KVGSGLNSSSRRSSKIFVAMGALIDPLPELPGRSLLSKSPSSAQVRVGSAAGGQCEIADAEPIDEFRWIILDCPIGRQAAHDPLFAVGRIAGPVPPVGRFEECPLTGQEGRFVVAEQVLVQRDPGVPLLVVDRGTVEDLIGFERPMVVE